MRPALHVPNPLAPKLLLEPRRAAPGRVLASLIGQDLPRHPVVGNAPRQRLQHQGTPLVVRHHQAHQVARVIIQEPHDVYPLVPPQQEREQIRLPQLVGLGPLKAPLLRPGLGPGRIGLARQPLLLEHPAHRRVRRANAKEALHHIANAPAARLRLRPLHLQHRLAPRIALDCTGSCRGAAGRPRLQRSPPAAPIPPHPLQERRVRNLQLTRHPECRHLRLHHHRGGRVHHVLRPRRPGLAQPPVCTFLLR